MMTPMIWRCVLVVLVVASTAAADSTMRVVLADSDPQLRRAVEASLRPWRIEVVVDPNVPADVTAAGTRADDRAARYVVWREGDQLVVFDRDRGQAEHRAAQLGSFDPLSAEAAALSIKTMMRLPPLATPDRIAATGPAPDPEIDLRVEAGTGARYERGLDGNVALRFGLGAMVRPWHDRGWRFGAIGDLGASASVDQAGFKGTWNNWSALAFVGWTWTTDHGTWELEPWAAIGIEHSALEGLEMGTPLDDSKILPAVRGGVAARRRFGRWSIGAIAAVEGVIGVPTYNKLKAPTAEIFEVPPFGLVGSIVVAADLAP